MKIRLLIVSCLLMLGMGAQTKEYNYQTVNGDLMNARIYTLDNGLKVYLTVNKEKPRIQTFIAVRTGSRNDPAQTTGLAHYLEHLMFKGTSNFGTSDLAKETPLLDSIEHRFEVYRTLTDPKQRKAYYHEIDSISQLAARYNIPNEYDKLMAAIGSEGSNAYTSNDVTCYTEDIPSNEVDNWAKIQSDRFKNMVIRGFHTELEAVYEEYNIGLAHDGEKEWNAMCAKLYPKHPYGTQTTIGTQEHLKNPSITNIKNYFNKYYCPNNVAVCMSGDFDPDAVMAIIDNYFGDWKSNANISRPAYAPVCNLTAPVDTAVIGQEAENILLAWKFDKAASYQADTLGVVSDMLSNGKAGLMDLDLDQKMAYLGGGAGINDMAEYSSFIMEGYPKEGQTLDDVRKLLIGEIEKLKRGEFDNDLLQSVINNRKLAYYKSLESNRDRANKFVDAFINGKKWSDVTGTLDRISKITKQQIVDFANRHLLDNYVAVYKRQGNDTTLKKIDKPQITAIPTNRDKQSKFVSDITNSHVTPIQPRFLDFDKDITKGKTKKGLPVLYIQNKDNGLFELTYYYKFGEESNKWLPYATSYFDYLGTDKLGAEQVKQQFYKLACSYKINVTDQSLAIRLNGLDENMPQALKLMEDFLANAKVDKDAYNEFVGLEEKERKDKKLNQRADFTALLNYGMYGMYNKTRNVPSSKELQDENPQQLVDMVKGLSGYEHIIEYYGPTPEKDFITAIDKEHKTAKKLLPAPEGKKYELQATDKNEILIAPYDSKNIYMRQYNCSNRKWTAEQQPIVELFNEYFGGGMNTVVFQELRESRGLAYNAWASYATPWRKDDPEYAMTHIISQNDKMMDCIRTFNHIIDSIPQSETSFNLAKQSLIKRLASSRTTKSDIFRAYIMAQYLGIDYDINKNVYNAVPALNLQDMVSFEQQTMAKKPYRYMILGDENNLDTKSLEKTAPIRRVSIDDIFGY